MTFYRVETLYGQYILPTNLVDENPVILDDIAQLKTNCNEYSLNGSKVYLIKESPTTLVSLMEAKLARDKTKIHQLHRELNIMDMPDSLRARIDEATYRIFAPTVSRISVFHYLANKNYDLNSLKEFYQLEPTLLKESPFIYSLSENQQDIWTWARNIGVIQNEQKLYEAAAEGRLHILKWAFDNHETMNLNKIARIAIQKSNPQMLSWSVSKMEGKENIEGLIILAQQLNEQSSIHILNQYRTKKIS